MKEQNEEIAVDTAQVVARCLGRSWTEYLALLDDNLDTFLIEQLDEEQLFV